MSFSAQITQFSVKTQKKLQHVRRGVTIKLFSAVILDTPVLTGRCRANWTLSVGEPKKVPTDNVDKAGSVAIAAVTEGVAASKGDLPVFLTNSLPYAGRLEYGYSKKAPEGMVRRNVIRFGRLIRIEASK